MFIPKNKKFEFLFIESKEKVLVFRSKSTEVKKITEFSFGDLSITLSKIKKEYPELIKSKNTWLLNTSSENIEKAPLEKAELLTYVKYKLQDLIDIPLNDISYDILTNNYIENSFHKKYATVIIVKKSHIDYITKAFASNKIGINAIDTTKTACLDFFERTKEISDKKVVAYLKVEDSRALMCVYYDTGLVFDRIIELPVLSEYEGKLDDVTQEVYDVVLDKLCLEIQRNVDFLDRQFGVQHFEKITYALPRRSILSNLHTDLTEYFKVKEVDFGPNLIHHAISGQDIPNSVLAFFERGTVRKEHINLLPEIKKANALKDNLTKVMSASLLFGMVGAGFGAYYEMQAKQFNDTALVTEKEVDALAKEMLQIKQKGSVVNLALEEEIKNLERNKNEIISLQRQSPEINKGSFNKTMADIAIQAKMSGVTLKQIKYNEKGLRLIGSVVDKDIFSAFLINLQNSEQLKGKSLSLITVQKENEIFIFNISSENMGAKE